MILKEYHESVRAIALQYNMDIDRVKAAVERYMQDEDMWTTWEACSVIQARIEAHQYPEPYVVPEQEKCINCFQPKDQHLPQCGLGSNADVPGWMMDESIESAKQEKAERRKQLKGKIQDKLHENRAEQGKIWPCRCNAGGLPIESYKDGWYRFDCKSCTTNASAETRVASIKGWNQCCGKRPESSWDNLPPCTCGSEQVGTNSITGTICCNDCERYLMRVCASTCLDQIASAWAEGKGKRGEVYRVEIDHEPAHKEGRLISAASIGIESKHEPAPHPAAYFDSDHRGTIDPNSTICGCGNEAMWDLLGGREDYKLICANYVSCHRQTASYQSPEAAREEWSDVRLSGLTDKAEIDSDHRRTVDPTSPACGCGQGAMWAACTDRREYKLICESLLCRRKTSLHPSPEAAREEWKSLNQFDQSANLANGPKGKNDQLPTWDDPGPCRCGWDKHFRGAGDRGAHIGCRRHGCNRTVMRSDKVTTLAAWIDGETSNE